MKQFKILSGRYYSMVYCRNSLLLFVTLTVYTVSSGQNIQKTFTWPNGYQMAISLTFDDARMSQVDVGTALLNKYNVKATFLVVPSGVKKRIEGWKEAVASGQEIGNHTLFHPCSGNFAWSREHALEDYTTDKIRNELEETNSQIQKLLGVKPQVFAYPCGSTFIGRGINTKSYVPLVAKLFLAGRGWLDEGPNDPSFCDLAQLTGMEMDGKDFDEILKLIEEAKKTNSWLVLAGHEIGDSGVQTTRVLMLKKLIDYCHDPKNGIWLAPMGTVGEFVQKNRKEVK